MTTIQESMINGKPQPPRQVTIKVVITDNRLRVLDPRLTGEIDLLEEMFPAKDR